MLGFAPIGRLAIGQLPSNGPTIVNLSATMTVRATAKSAVAAPAPITAKMSVRVAAKVVPGVNIASQLHAAIAARATGGVVLPGRIIAEAKLRVTPGANIASRLHTSTSLRVQPGMAIPGRISVAAKARVTPGANLTSSISARVMMRAPGGVVLPARITIQVKGRADQFFYPGSGHSFLPGVPQPAYEVERAKPFRPIWDIRRRQEVEEERRAETAPPPLPPAELFDRPQATVTVELRNLPDYAALVPGNWRDVEEALREAQDATDAEIVLKAVVDTDAGDFTDAIAALEATADRLLAAAVEQARAERAPAQSRHVEIAMPSRTDRRGGLSFDEQMQDVADHADAMNALRGIGLVPEEV